MIFSFDSPYPRAATTFALLLAAAAACGGAKEDVPGGSSGQPGSSGGTTPPSTSTPGGPTCDAAAARDIAVAGDDPNGYPPYAIAECSLVYVSSAGELVLRDLATSAEMKLATTAEKPRRPSISIDVIDANTRRSVIVWETTLAAGPTVRVRYGDKVTTLTGDFIMATEPRVSGNQVVFTAWKGGNEADDTDVWLYDARTDKSRVVIGGPSQQRFADVSGTHVVATDFAEDPDGYYNRVDDLADLVTFEIASEKVTRRVVPGKQAFPMLGKDGALAYLDWNGVHPQPKLEAYNLKAGSLFTDPSTDRLVAAVRYVSTNPQRPAISGDTIEWIANPDGNTVLYRAPTNGATAPVRVEGLDGLLLYAPAPRPAMGDRPAFTVVAAIEIAKREAPRLRAVSH